MRLAILSDIHGNYDALETVLIECKRYKIDKYLFLGDYVGYYYEPKKVWDTVKKLGDHIIKGNHEDLLGSILSCSKKENEIIKKYGIGHRLAKDQLSKDDIRKLCSLPEKITISYGKYKIQLNHGSPWDQNQYLYPDTNPKILERANQSNIDFILVGHSHYPFIKKLTNSTLINSGSVGQSRQKGGIANWVFIDLKSMNTKIINTKYSISNLAKKVKIYDPNIDYNYTILFRQ